MLDRRSTIQLQMVPHPASDGAAVASTLGHYVVDGALGQGGMGAVFHARDTRTGATVALKTLTRVDPAGIYRLKNEFRALANITHPNLVRLYELACIDEEWFFTMERVEGVPFSERVGLPRPGDSSADATTAKTLAADGGEEPPADEALAEAHLREAFSQLVSGIAAIHDAGKFHCDIKPSNVLIDGNGRVVILDFGIAKCADPADPASTSPDEISGTPDYMSPEQATGQPLTAASDWYAVGVMLYEALCGELPFEGNSFAVMSAKQQTSPVPPSTRHARVPSDLESLCMALLARDPQQRPHRTEIAQRLCGSSQRPTLPPPYELPVAAGPLVGRDFELTALRDAATALASGEPQFVLLTGRSGIGKSSVMLGFARELALRSGTIVLRGQCYERESMPYKAFDSIVDDLTRFLRRLSDREVAQLLPRDVYALARMFPVLKRIRAVAAVRGKRIAERDLLSVRRSAVRAFKELLGRIADSHTLVLLIDDLQWGDPESAELLMELLEPPDPPAVLVVGTARSEDREQSLLLRELLSHASLARLGQTLRILELPALEPAAARALTDSLLGKAGGGALAQAIMREAGGHPLFVHELSRYALASQARDSDRWAQALDRRELSIDGMLSARIAALPQLPRRVLQLVSVCARPVSQLVLKRIEPEADAALFHQLAHERLLRMLGSSGAAYVDCYHDHVRRAVLALLPSDQLKLCHRTLAAAIEESAAVDAEALAEHLRAAGELERAREHMLVSAEAAVHAFAFARAARLYELAIDIGTGEEWQQGALHKRWADALAAAGRTAQAASVYLEAARRSDAMEAIELRRLAAQHFLSSGQEGPGLEILRELLRQVGLEYPETERATIGRLLWERAKLRVLGLRFRARSPAIITPLELARVDVCFSAAVGLSMSDLARSAAFSARALRLALWSGEGERIARALTFELGIAAAAGVEGVRWAERALPLAERLQAQHGGPYHEGLLYLARAHVAYMQGRWRPTVDWVERAEPLLREARGLDVQWARLAGHVLSAISLVLGGELERAAERMPGFLREAEERGDQHGIALMAYARVLLALAQDDVPAARAALSQSLPPSQAYREFRLRDFQRLHCQLLIDRYSGDRLAAWQRLSEHWSTIEQSKLLLVNILRVTALAERASAALDMAAEGGGPQYVELARQAALALSGERLPHAQALACLLRARLPSEGGALEWLRAASERFDACGMALHAESARRCIGQLTSGALGLQWVEQADARLSRLGVRQPERFAALMVPGFAMLGTTQEES